LAGFKDLKQAFLTLCKIFFLFGDFLQLSVPETLGFLFCKNSLPEPSVSISFF